jgi:hypothetical protein
VTGGDDSIRPRRQGKKRKKMFLTPTNGKNFWQKFLAKIFGKIFLGKKLFFGTHQWSLLMAVLGNFGFFSQEVLSNYMFWIKTTTAANNQ